MTTATLNGQKKNDTSLLTFTRLQVGQTIIGVIKTVNDFDLVLSLPNHLTGFVACDRTSVALGDLFAQAASSAKYEKSQSEVDTSTKKIDLPSLKKWYKSGEIVIGVIKNIQDPKRNIGITSDSAQSKRRIEISLLPEDVNCNILPDSISPGVILAGEILTREDRGYTVALGISNDKNDSLLGFLPDADAIPGLEILKTIPLLVSSSFQTFTAPEDLKSSRGLKDGKKRRKDTSRVVTLTGLLDNFSNSPIKSKDAASLRCGCLVDCKIESTNRTFITVSFNGFQGNVDILNLPDAVMMKRNRDLDLSELFPVGTRMPLRIAFCDFGEKTWLLTAKLLTWTAKSDEDFSIIGSRIEKALLIRSDPTLGALFSISNAAKSTQNSNEISSKKKLSDITLKSKHFKTSKDIISASSTLQAEQGSVNQEAEGTEQFAYVHISRLSDEHIKTMDFFKVGSKHNLRIIDHDVFSGLFLASAKQSTWDEEILRVEDLTPGRPIRGEAIAVEKYGVVVALSPRIRAICPINHLSETQTPGILDAFNVGQKYKFRVLDCDPSTRRITLTRKKGLLESSLPILQNLNQACVGSFYDGYIVALKSFGALVRFYGEARGIVTVAELTDEYLDTPQDSYFVGQVVRCRVLKVDSTAGNLTLSLRKTTGPKKRTHESTL